jgi:hypothetical protein
MISFVNYVSVKPYKYINNNERYWIIAFHFRYDVMTERERECLEKFMHLLQSTKDFLKSFDDGSFLPFNIYECQNSIYVVATLRNMKFLINTIL